MILSVLKVDALSQILMLMEAISMQIQSIIIQMEIHQTMTITAIKQFSQKTNLTTTNG